MGEGVVRGLFPAGVFLILANAIGFWRAATVFAVLIFVRIVEIMTSGEDE